MTIHKVISGAQTGADRGALYAALSLNVAIGGWVPRGFKSEDGIIPADLQPFLRETETDKYRERTEKNVDEAHATLLLHHGTLGVGSHLTLNYAIARKKPICLVNVRDNSTFVSHSGKSLMELSVVYFFHTVTHALPPATLNVAGPRESNAPGLQDDAYAFMRNSVLSLWAM